MKAAQAGRRWAFDGCWPSPDPGSGVDTIVWSQGPGSAETGRAPDNSDLYGVMLRAAKLGK